tara:strand:- start:306 stop:722 length:417 start_codon:yes stop_codon:yes gene_type:complete
MGLSLIISYLYLWLGNCLYHFGFTQKEKIYKKKSNPDLKRNFTSIKLNSSDSIKDDSEIRRRETVFHEFRDIESSQITGIIIPVDICNKCERTFGINPLQHVVNDLKFCHHCWEYGGEKINQFKKHNIPLSIKDRLIG